SLPDVAAAPSGLQAVPLWSLVARRARLQWKAGNFVKLRLAWRYRIVLLQPANDADRQERVEAISEIPNLRYQNKYQEHQARHQTPDSLCINDSNGGSQQFGNDVFHMR